MRYIPATNEEVQEMLSAVGATHLSDLFSAIPQEFRLDRPLDLPEALCEWELTTHMEALAGCNEGRRYSSFLGGGAYRHFTSAVIDQLIARSEFATAYTPYQPEVSQGTLQAIFEFQTFVCNLFEMEVANASVYDAASGLAEACLMAHRALKRKSAGRIVISQAVNPEYRQVVRTYLSCTGLEVVEVPFGPDGATDLEAIEKEAAQGATAIVVQSPNYFGTIENLGRVRSLADQHDALFVVAMSEPVSMGVLAPPGQFGADIVVAEGQSFGIPLSFGGPYVGLFASRDKYVRSMPGRIVGRTVDADDNDGFVLTLSTREQHIRRNKATSNICTNQGLCALAATIYLSLVGKKGLEQLARRNLSKSIHLKKAISALPAFDIPFNGPTFNEFVVRSQDLPVDTLMRRLEEHHVLAGIPLGKQYERLEQCFLVTVTEMSTRAEMDRLVELLEKEGRK